MGVTLIYYINNLRIEKAKSLLLSTDLTAEQISEQVGIKTSIIFSDCLRNLQVKLLANTGKDIIFEVLLIL